MFEGKFIIDAIAQLQDTLAAQSYVCDDRLATVLFLSLNMRRPLFLEGEPGTGKTEQIGRASCRERVWR